MQGRNAPWRDGNPEHRLSHGSFEPSCAPLADRLRLPDPRLLHRLALSMLKTCRQGSPIRVADCSSLETFVKCKESQSDTSVPRRRLLKRRQQIARPQCQSMRRFCLRPNYRSVRSFGCCCQRIPPHRQNVTNQELLQRPPAGKSSNRCRD